MKPFKHFWKQIANNKMNSASAHIEFVALKALNSRSNHEKELILRALLDEAFTPVTNQVKLANGRTPYDTMTKSANYLNYSLRHGKPENITILGQHWAEILDSNEELEAYIELLKTITSNMLKLEYVYIFVAQEDVTPEQQLVQSSHAALLLGTRLANHQRVDKLHFVVIGIDHTDVTGVEFELMKTNIPFATFHEPDLGNRMTALAAGPVSWNHRKMFRTYKLLTFDIIELDGSYVDSEEEPVTAYFQSGFRRALSAIGL